MSRTSTSGAAATCARPDTPTSSTSPSAGRARYNFTLQRTLNPKRVGKEVHLKYNVGRVDVVTIDMPFLNARETDWVEKWIDAGEFEEFGVGAKFKSGKFLGSLLLDTVNIALALGAVRDADTGSAKLLAAGAISVHSMNLVSAIGEEYAKKVLKDRSLRVATRVFAAHAASREASSPHRT